MNAYLYRKIRIMLIRIGSLCLLLSLFSCGNDGSDGPTAEAAAATLAKQGIEDYNPNNDSQPLDSLLRLEMPLANKALTSPIQVKGEATTSFFYEGTMRYLLTNEQGQSLAEGFIKAKKVDFNRGMVIFDDEINYEAPAGTKGFLRLENNQASKVVGFQRAMTIPVVL